MKLGTCSKIKEGERFKFKREQFEISPKAQFSQIFNWILSLE